MELNKLPREGERKDLQVLKGNAKPLYEGTTNAGEIFIEKFNKIGPDGDKTYYITRRLIGDEVYRVMYTADGGDVILLPKAGLS